MNKFKQILVSAIIAVLLAITFFFLIGEPESEIVGIIAFILMILHYRKKNKEEMKKAEERKKLEEEERRKEEVRKRLEEKRKRLEEEERQKAEAERKRKEEERQKAEAERKRKEEERQKAEAERKRKEEEERQKAEAERKRKEEEESFDWDYDQSSQTLTISGQGHMPNDWHPWGTLLVHNIIIKDGVTSISAQAFMKGKLNADGGLYHIDFGNTLQEIEDMAFNYQPLKDGHYVLPASLRSIGRKAFDDSYFYDFNSPPAFCLKSQNPPSLGDNSTFPRRSHFEIPTGCLKKYLALSCWQDLADRIEEKDVSLMLSSLELEAIKVENKHKEEEKRKEEEERQKAEEKRRREEERRKAAEEEKKRKEEEERQKAEEEEFKSEYEAELRKKMGL